MSKILTSPVDALIEKLVLFLRLLGSPAVQSGEPPHEALTPKAFKALKAPKVPRKVRKHRKPGDFVSEIMKFMTDVNVAVSRNDIYKAMGFRFPSPAVRDIIAGLVKDGSLVTSVRSGGAGRPAEMLSLSEGAPRVVAKVAKAVVPKPAKSARARAAKMWLNSLYGKFGESRHKPEMGSKAAKPAALKVAKPAALKAAKPVLLKDAKPVRAKAAKPVLLKAAKPVLLKDAKPVLLKDAKPVRAKAAKR